MSDARLVARARAGDERAFELLVRRHRAGLVSYCRRLGLDGRAEDAVQQAFLSAWLALRSGQEVRDVRSWLGRITHNKAVDLLRAGTQAPAGGLPPSSAVGGFEQSLELRQTLAAVAALPPRQRDALLLSAIEGRSYEEVADALGLSEGAVRGLLHRARATLRAAAGALTPLPAAWLRRAWMPAGRAAEAIAPNVGGGAAGATWRAAVAAVTTVAVAVAVGPLHGLVAGHARHHTAHAEARPGPAATPRADREISRASAASATAASGSQPARSERVSGTNPTATARAPVPAAKVRVQTPAPARPPTVGGQAPPEPSPSAPAPTTAAVASAPSGQSTVETPAASTPVPETPPVTAPPESAKAPEAPEHEEETQRQVGTDN